MPNENRTIHAPVYNPLDSMAILALLVTMVLPPGAGAGAGAAQAKGPPPSPKEDLFRQLQEIHADQLARLALELEPKERSLDLEVRDLAIALSRKIAPGAKSLADTGKAKRRPMTPEEEKADQEVRQAHAASEKDLEAPAPRPPAQANVRHEFEAMRWEIARETVDFAAVLSLDPANLAELKLRQAVLAKADEILSSPKRTWEKDLKKRIGDLRKEKYVPKGEGK